ncbi:hypothetical protein Dda_8311 [Drechslerella dactyloides]|uniref:Uncharacterized protein n=1 Tax=Drechslerella dactyloides TaxID=74499 RepID=A0AAD6IS66_DREDA|nr:hypothetical protein Dda_8311 [Drechslerella dactyloides]
MPSNGTLGGCESSISPSVARAGGSISGNHAHAPTVRRFLPALFDPKTGPDPSPVTDIIEDSRESAASPASQCPGLGQHLEAQGPAESR